MSKKLPGLKRHAPDIDAEPTTESDPAPTPKAAPKAKTKSKPKAQAKTQAKAEPKKRTTHAKTQRPRREASENEHVTIDEPSAFEGERKIEAEVLQPEPLPPTDTLDEAMEIVHRRSNWATVGGLVPIPVLDSIVIAGVQLDMLADLSKLYGVPFERNRAKSIVMALVSGAVSCAAGAGVLGLLGKSLPWIGWGLGLATVSVLARASTQATGIVFVQHFESGGTLFDFDPVVMREIYRREFEKARRRATGF